MQKKLLIGLLVSLALAGEAFAIDDARTGTVIVGSGISGMKAAIDLAENGQQVLVLEKLPYLGGTTNLAAQYFVVVNTKAQQEKGAVITVPDYIKREEKGGRNLSMLQRTARRVSDSEAMVQWLNGIGADMNRVVSDYQVGIGDGSSLGPRLVKVLTEKAKAAGVPVRTNSKVVDLVVENGRVAGVVVEAGKERYRVFADNVILATGGFARNQELVGRFAPDWKGLPTTTGAGSTGDGIVLAEKVGAVTNNAGEIWLNPSIHSQDGVNVSMSAARLEGGIMVNLEGKRFCNDYNPNYSVMARQMMQQPEGKSFVVIDGKSMQASKRLQGFLKKGYFLEAPTVKELAAKMGVPADALEETVRRYGEFARKGEDGDFGRGFNMKTDFTTPPYYASSLVPGTQTCIGGLDVNDFMQCRTADGKPITNLYAVGELTYDASTVHGYWSGWKAAEHILSKQ